MPGHASERRYATALWFFLGYTVAVVLWGAFVRATLSGDGCGDHWPLCNGEVFPVAPTKKTLIELTHRITSGACWIGALALFVWARRVFSAGDLARHAMGWGLFFMTTEALVGAGLVLFRMVASNPSTARAYWMAAHLTNTFLLLFALTVAAWAASWGRGAQLQFEKKRVGLFAGAFAAVLVVGITGAIAALGDTLFPASSLVEGLQQDFSPTAHLFERRRVWHPLVAVITAAYLGGLGAWGMSFAGPHVRFFATLLLVLVGVQIGAGLLNVVLLAPVWMQLIHLLLADALWITLVLMAVSCLALPTAEQTAT